MSTIKILIEHSPTGEREDRRFRAGGEWNLLHGAYGYRTDDLLVEVAPVDVLVEDHELCEHQINELVGELRHIKDSPAWTQLSHALKDRVTRAIRTRGLPDGR